MIDFYKIIIVDDEFFIRDGLASYDFEKLGFKIVGTASNRKEAALLDSILDGDIDDSKTSLNRIFQYSYITINFHTYRISNNGNLTKELFKSFSVNLYELLYKPLLEWHQQFLVVLVPMNLAITQF
ncbi:hypothetical protein SAMN05444401_2376 [Clostridium amylolyticum]|uniref:Stage 0 sporulation protein A homolog n=1 Tax=Clostridium amylolyticum TaxID=1121298 RepID=A0A1M6H5A1_9CLOT|nr:hypothetical protein [Clostridium amylolyticum]SHJ17381.1 hypothetical protein SAMN05444401_2376 [Clostridium amylolyticum]